MADMVYNKIEIECTESQSKKIIKDITNKSGLFTFEKILPTPINMFLGDVGSTGERFYDKNNWYEWRIKNWYTKWDAIKPKIEYKKKLVITFKSAYGPPKPIITAVINIVDKHIVKLKKHGNSFIYKYLCEFTDIYGIYELRKTDDTFNVLEYHTEENDEEKDMLKDLFNELMDYTYDEYLKEREE